MKKEIKGYINVALILLIIWGIAGLIEGDGFIGGISSRIDVIGEIVSFFIKAVLIIAVIWFIIEIFKDKEKE